MWTAVAASCRPSRRLQIAPPRPPLPSACCTLSPVTAPPCADLQPRHRRVRLRYSARGGVALRWPGGDRPGRLASCCGHHPAGLRHLPGGAVHRCLGLRRRSTAPAGACHRLLLRLRRQYCLPCPLRVCQAGARPAARPGGWPLPKGEGRLPASSGWVLPRVGKPACCSAYRRIRFHLRTPGLRATGHHAPTRTVRRVLVPAVQVNCNPPGDVQVAWPSLPPLLFRRLASQQCVTPIRGGAALKNHPTSRVHFVPARQIWPPRPTLCPTSIHAPTRPPLAGARRYVPRRRGRLAAPGADAGGGRWRHLQCPAGAQPGKHSCLPAPAPAQLPTSQLPLPARCEAIPGISFSLLCLREA